MALSPTAKVGSHDTGFLPARPKMTRLVNPGKSYHNLSRVVNPGWTDAETERVVNPDST